MNGKTDRENYEHVVRGLIEHGQAIGKLVQRGDGAYYLESLLKVYDWAIEQQPFKVGDRVRAYCGPFKQDHGYWHWNDIWIERPLGVVKRVEFNGSHLYWAFLVEFDKIQGKTFGFSERSLRIEIPDDSDEFEAVYA